MGRAEQLARTGPGENRLEQCSQSRSHGREAPPSVEGTKENLQKQEQLVLQIRNFLKKRFKDLHQQISSAISSGHYVPPNPAARSSLFSNSKPFLLMMIR
jgi:hypothetical protein